VPTHVVLLADASPHANNRSEVLWKIAPTKLLAKKYYRQIEWMRNAKANVRPQADLAATA
jgi:hypothetical protein